MKRIFLGASMMMLLFPAATGAQATQTVRGQVCDVASGEPMIGVTITVENGMTVGTVSDAEGERFLILVNVRNEQKTANIPQDWVNHQTEDEITDQDITLKETMTLEPYQYLIMKF